MPDCASSATSNDPQPFGGVKFAAFPAVVLDVPFVQVQQLGPLRIDGLLVQIYCRYGPQHGWFLGRAPRPRGYHKNYGRQSRNATCMGCVP